MDDYSGLESDIDWNTDDELEIESFQPSCSTVVPSGQTITNGSVEPSSFAGPSNTKVFDHFISMGFPGEVVSKVIQMHGEENEEKLLNEILTYSVLESSPQQQQQAELDPTSSECAGSSWDDISEDDFFSDEELPKFVSRNDETLTRLVKMGFEEEEALVAIDRIGSDSLEALVDFIGAAQVAKAENALLPPEDKPGCSGNPKLKKRSLYEYEVLGKKRPKLEKRTLCEDEEEAQTLNLPNPMMGFGIPNEPSSMITHRRLPENAIGPPYFYYENVALAPKGVWQTISRFLYDVEPEYVDSKYFCAAARKRGYIHNLPIVNRFPLLPLPPRTIHDAFPLLRRWWPTWDPRTKLNCLQTVHASAKLTDRIRKAVESCDEFEEPSETVKKYVLDQCRKWNLVWVGKNKVAPLEPDEVEMLLGFPRNHTRGGGISRTDRFKSLGNSFQVDTVAYHLSVLKEMYPKGVNILSLFSGIGGAEVALHRLGIPLRNVVSVEKSEVNRNIVRSWWEQTNQRGNLVDFDDVQQLDADRLERLMGAFGGFDLIVGGSPCNNLVIPSSRSIRSSSSFSMATQVVSSKSPSSSKGWNISSIAARIYLLIIIFQVPLFRVTCRSGLCTTPLHVTSSQLVASDVFPVPLVKGLLYPGAALNGLIHNMTVPTWDSLLDLYNLTTIKEASAVTDLQRLEVLAGSYFAVAGALVGILKPGRMSMFGSLLVIWGLVKEGILGKPVNTDPAKAVYVYPTMVFAMICAFLSVKYDMKKVTARAAPVRSTAKPLKSSSKSKLK